MSEALGLLDPGFRLIYREDRLDDALRGLDEDFELVATDHPDGAVHRGPQGVTEFFRDWIEQWEEPEPEAELALERTGPDTVLALATIRGRGRASGVPVEPGFAQVWTFRDGVPIRMVLYADAHKARAAASAGS